MPNIGSLEILANLNTASPNFSGDVTIGGNLHLPDTNAAGTVGVVTMSGNRFITDPGINNAFFGTNSGIPSTTGTNNTGIGTNALTNNAAGSNNTAVGNNSLANNTVD